MDAETGRIAGGDDGVALLDEAIARIHGEKVMPTTERAVAMQAASAKARIRDRMPKREALKHWRNPHLTNAEAITLMDGWSAPTAYRELKSRGIASGPKGRAA